jgi:hypothetical protein
MTAHHTTVLVAEFGRFQAVADFHDTRLSYGLFVENEGRWIGGGSAAVKPNRIPERVQAIPLNSPAIQVANVRYLF